MRFMRWVVSIGGICEYEGKSEHQLMYGAAAEGEVLVREENGAISDAREAVFPIFVYEQNKRFRAVGTGFFISNPNLFATAAHVLRESLSPEGKIVCPLYVGQFAPGKKIYFRQVMQATIHPIADVAIGLLVPIIHKTTGKPFPNKYFPLASRYPRVGESIATFAFPKTRVSEGNIQDIDMYSGYYPGVVLEHYPDGRDTVIMQGPCYRTSMVLHGGSSGGPVSNSDGSIFGINGTAFDNDRLSFVSCISSLNDLYLSDVKLSGDEKPRQRMGFSELLRNRVVSVE